MYADLLIGGEVLANVATARSSADQETSKWGQTHD